MKLSNYNNAYEETSRDVHLAKIKLDLIDGNSYESQYQIKNGISFTGQRVVVPTSMHQTVFGGSSITTAWHR